MLGTMLPSNPPRTTDPFLLEMISASSLSSTTRRVISGSEGEPTSPRGQRERASSVATPADAGPLCGAHPDEHAILPSRRPSLPTQTKSFLTDASLFSFRTLFHVLLVSSAAQLPHRV